VAWVCGFSLAGIAGSNPADSTVLSLVSAVGYKVEVSCVCLITRPEEPYLVWCVWVWSWSRDSESLVHWGPSCHEKKNLFITIHNAFVFVDSDSCLNNRAELDICSYVPFFHHSDWHCHSPTYWPFLLNNPVFVVAPAVKSNFLRTPISVQFFNVHH